MYDPAMNVNITNRHVIWMRSIPRISGIIVQVLRNQTTNVDSVLPTNRRKNRENQPSAGRLPPQYRQLRSKRLVSVATISRIRIQ